MKVIDLIVLIPMCTNVWLANYNDLRDGKDDIKYEYNSYADNSYVKHVIPHENEIVIYI